MKGVLLKDLYIAGSNVVVTVIMLAVLGFGLSFLMEPSTILILAWHNYDSCFYKYHK